MFEKFYDFVGVENKNNVTDMSGFMDIYGGETFLNGLYRIHNKNDIKNGMRYSRELSLNSKMAYRYSDMIG